MGIRFYAKKAREENEKIRAVIILEMIGYYSEKKNSQKHLPLLGPFYPNRADFITIVGNLPSRELVVDLLASFKKSSSFPIVSIVAPDFIPGLNFSDHASFWEQGFPAVMITDTAYMRNPHYHKSTDLTETLNYEKMSLVIHGLRGAILQLDQEVRRNAG
jgi:Zn-dependent M28 family amino/carboxypeptidase